MPVPVPFCPKRMLMSAPTWKVLRMLQTRNADVPLELADDLKRLQQLEPPSQLTRLAARLVERLYEPGGEGATAVKHTTAVGAKRKHEGDKENHKPEDESPAAGSAAAAATALSLPH